MHTKLFNNLFKPFLERNPHIFKVSSINGNNDAVIKNKISDKDKQYFTNLINELKNQKIKSNINNIYNLLYNECVNINNDISQKKVIASTLKGYIYNILQEINEQILFSLEDKTININYTKSQKYKMNKKNLRTTIKLLFMILIFMINKYKNIIDDTFHGYVKKGINVENLPSNKIKEELFFLLIIQQNLFWMEIIIDSLLNIFQYLKNNKYRLLLNADTEFNNLDDSFKISCFNCFLHLFNIIKKYSSIKLNIDSNQLFDNSLISDISKYDNQLLPIKIKNIDHCVFKLYECFIYEFLYDIDSLWKYFDNMNLNVNSNYEKLYCFGIYLCEFIKLISFIRNDNISKIDFFNFYIFSYNLVTNYFSKLNKYLYGIYTELSKIIKFDLILVMPNFNLNYLQNLSNELKDMLFNFMIFSYNNDTLKDAYSYNEILMNSIVSHCLIKTIISIYSLIMNQSTDNLLLDIINILIDNVAKYKLILPLKCHFHKELMTHNFLLILDEFLVNYENEIVIKFRGKYKDKIFGEKINKLINKFNEVLSCLFNHYNFLNFIYSNHAMYKFNQILIKSGIYSPYYFSSTSNIFLRYIYSEKNFLYFKDIPLSIINYFENENEKNDITRNAHMKLNLNIYNEINFDNATYNNDMTIDNKTVTNMGFALDKYLDQNSVQLFSNIDLDDYEFNIFGDKNYLMKIIGTKNYSNVVVRNEGFIEKLGVDENLKENILNIMENNQYIDKNVYKLIQEKVLHPNNRNIIINDYFYENIKYYDLKFEMNFFEYQNKIKELLI